MRTWSRWTTILALSFLWACGEESDPEVPDVVATRVVTLAPNLTELVYAAGAGATLIGVSAYSDYPDAALTLPVIGDAFSVDQEQLELLRPDLILVWESGTPGQLVDELRRNGYRVEVIRTRTLSDIAFALRRIGDMTGYAEEADAAARRYAGDLQSLRDRYAGRAPLKVFYQVSRRPLYTVSGSHYISELIEICGGDNVFDSLSELAPTIDVEAVVDRDPEVMLAATDAGADAFLDWERWPHIAANRFANRFLMPANEIGRPTPRVLLAGEALCQSLQEARNRREAALAISQ